jgi:hypothetical protein
VAVVLECMELVLDKILEKMVVLAAEVVGKLETLVLEV